MVRTAQNHIENSFFLLVYTFARLLSYEGTRVLGRVLGSLAYLSGFRKGVTLENLAHAFPEKDKKDRIRIARGAYRNYATCLTQMLWASRQTEEQLRSIAETGGVSLFQKLKAHGKGVILISGHFGTWEFIVLPLRLLLEEPMTIVVQRQRNSLIDSRIDSMRCRFGNVTIPLGPSSRGILAALFEGKVVSMLVDQSGPREAAFVNFFGRPAATHRGAAALSLKTGAPLLFCAFIAKPDGRWEIALEEVDRTGLDEYSEENIVELTQRHASLLEKYVRLHPDHWLWMHKRWKHTKAHQEMMRHENSRLHGVSSSKGTL